MNGVHVRYPYPKWVWSPTGGWWAHPRAWKRNTFAAYVVFLAINIPIAIHGYPCEVSGMFIYQRKKLVANHTCQGGQMTLMYKIKNMVSLIANAILPQTQISRSTRFALDHSRSCLLAARASPRPFSHILASVAFTSLIMVSSSPQM